MGNIFLINPMKEASYSRTTNATFQRRVYTDKSVQINVSRGPSLGVANIRCPGGATMKGNLQHIWKLKTSKYCVLQVLKSLASKYAASPRTIQSVQSGSPFSQTV